MIKKKENKGVLRVCRLLKMYINRNFWKSDTYITVIFGHLTRTFYDTGKFLTDSIVHRNLYASLKSIKYYKCWSLVWIRKRQAYSIAISLVLFTRWSKDNCTKMVWDDLTFSFFIFICFCNINYLSLHFYIVYDYICFTSLII